MISRRALAVGALPGAAALAGWKAYRRLLSELGDEPALRPQGRGRVRSLSTSWGRLSYRLVTRSAPGPALVLVHGWGRVADGVWCQLIEETDRTVLAVDLPGHGRSLLEKPFTIELAAEAVMQAIADSGIVRPILVGHSMGGPVCLAVLRQSSNHAFSGLIAVATSAYWGRPRQQMIIASAPYLLAQNSPILVGFNRVEMRKDPQAAPKVAWEYALRPSRTVLKESARALRAFDARHWENLTLPASLWIVTSNDGIVRATDQQASAAHFSIPTIAVESTHSEFIRNPKAVGEIIEAAAREWGRQLPIGIRPRAHLPDP